MMHIAVAELALNLSAEDPAPQMLHNMLGWSLVRIVVEAGRMARWGRSARGGIGMAMVWLVSMPAGIPALGADNVQPPFDIEGGGGYAKAEQDESEWGGVPAVFRTPETGVGAGAVLIYLPPQLSGKASSVLSGGVLTEKKQSLASVYTEQYFAHDLWAAELYVAYQDYPDLFFGVGNDTKVADQEPYTWRQHKAAVSLRRLLTPDLRVGLNAVSQTDNFTKVQTGGLLDSGQVYGRQGGESRGLGGSLRWDTCDDAYSPTRGESFNVLAIRYDRHLGSEYSFNFYELNLKKFWSLNDKTVIAGQIYHVVNAGGDVPFYQLALMGGKNLLRGYYQGRFRDRNMLVAQSEYRRRLWRRWGGVVFGGFGEVSHDLAGLALTGAKPTTGFGLRYQLVEHQRINVRLDFGFGRNESNPSVYLYLLDAF